MVKIKKSDLQYKYSWTTIGDDDPKVTGDPDSTMFSRNEGYEVLYLVNKLAEDFKFENKVSSLKIEKMIKENLPSDVRSQNNVKKWIYDNWNNF